MAGYKGDKIMRFEQAFYTRGPELLNTRDVGLGISASSNLEDSFIKKCMSIGGKFDAEGSEEMAEFVLYSEEFKSFVGIGLSPSYDFSESKIDMICHLFIPVEEGSKVQRLCSPEKYYLLYPFKDNVKKRSDLEQVELASCFSDSDYQSILRKYHFDQKKLAYFLYKLYPILFNEKNQLLIVLNNEYYKKYSEIAREITWLASCLVPKAGEQSVPYRKRLSYGVYSQRNISRVNIAYSEKEELHNNRFYLNKETKEEIPELYFTLAQKALKSQQLYLEFIDQMLESAIEKEINSDNLLIMYLLWKLEQKQEISKPSFSIEPLIRKAKNNPKYKNKLSLYILLADELSEQELSNLWNTIISPPLYTTESEKDNIYNALKRIIVLMYDINKKKYKTFIEQLPENSSKEILEDLYALEDSCIKKHLNEIKNMKELLNTAQLYYRLGEIQDYSERIKNISSNLDKIKFPQIQNKFSVYLSALPHMNSERHSMSQTDIWNTCGDDISARIFCSQIFGLEKYSIWSVVSFLDIGQYQKIYYKLEKEKDGNFIETTQLKAVEMEKANFNRSCYCLWKQIVIQKKCDLQEINKFDLNKYFHEVTNFLDELKKAIIKEPSDRENCIIYIKLELKKEELYLREDKEISNIRYKSYEELKNYSLLYKKILTISGVEGEIFMYLEELKQWDSDQSIGISQKYNKRKKSVSEVEENLYKEIKFQEREVMNKTANFEEEVRNRFNQLEYEISNIKKGIEQNNNILKLILDIVKKNQQFDRIEENNLSSQIINHSSQYKGDNNKNMFSVPEKDTIKFDRNTKPDYYL